MKKKTATLRTSVSSSTLAPSRSLRTARGWTTRNSSRQSALSMISMRMTLRPPVVEPAQPPMNISSSSTNCAATAQLPKSCEVKPVPVRMETTWNRAGRSASAGAQPLPCSGAQRPITTSVMAMATKLR